MIFKINLLKYMKCFNLSFSYFSLLFPSKEFGDDGDSRDSSGRRDGNNSNSNSVLI